MTDRVRRATPEDAAALSRLFLEVFGHERSDELWRWKFFSHPVGAWSFVYEARGEIVAHCGATAVRFRVRDREILALQLVDFMSSPRFPGGIGAGGVFARTTTAMFRHILSSTDARLLYGFPGERHRIVGERLLGYTTAGPIGELRLECGAQPQVLPAASGDDAVSRALEPADLTRFDPLPSPLHAIRDVGYLRWRYIDHPAASYEIVETKARWFRKPASRAIIRRDGDTAHLMELGGSFAPHDLRELAGQLSRLGGVVVGWCSPDHVITERLAAAGFELGLRDHSLAAAWFLERPEPERRRFFSADPPAGREFYISLGDYDVY